MIDNDPPLKITKRSIDKQNSNNNKNYLDIGRDWSLLPVDILGTISSLLTIKDYVAFSNVCTSWKSFAGPLSPQMPFLLLNKGYSDSYLLLNLPDNLSYKIELPQLRGRSLVGSQDGWLILLDKTENVFTLFNPCTQQEMKMPSHPPSRTSENELLRRIYRINFAFVKVVLSSVSTDSTMPALAAIALQRNGCLMYKHAGDDKWKNDNDHNNIRLKDIYCWRGQFVAVQGNGTVFQLHFNAAGDCMFECLGSPSYEGMIDIDCYLVELDGYLFQVRREFSFYTGESRKVLVSKLDLKLLSWSPIDDLNDHSLFLGTSHSVALSSGQIPGLKENRIYFINERVVMKLKKMQIRSYGKVEAFDMKTGRCEICYLEKSPFILSSINWFAPLPSELQNASFRDDFINGLHLTK